MAQEDCELNLQAHYPMKNPQEIKNAVKFIDMVRGNITDRGELRSFIDMYSKAKQLELGTKLLAELDTIGKAALNMDRILSPKWNGDHLQAALSLYEETSSNVKGAGINVERTIQVKQKAFWGSFYSELSKIGFSKEFQAGAFDKEIRDVIRTGVPYAGNEALAVNQTASLLKKYYSIMNHELNAAGLRVAYRADYDGPLVHDGSAIYGRFDDWAKALYKALDFRKEFPEVPEQDIQNFEALIRSGESVEGKSNAVVKLLGYSYERIVATESALRDELPHSLERPPSISERRSYAKTFTTWRSGQAVTEYLAEFGKYKTLNEQIEYYTRSTARDVGLTSVLGATPSRGHEMVKDLVKRQMKLAKKTPAEIKDAIKTIDLAYDNIISPRIPNPDAIGEMLMYTRVASAQAKLGMAGFTSMMLDPVTTSLQRRTLLGEGLIKSVYETYKTYIPMMMEAANRPDVEDAYLFSQYDLSTSLEEWMHMARGLKGAENKITSTLQFTGEVVSKASGAYYMNKVAHMVNAKMYTKFLADAANSKSVTPQMRADLQKFNIGPADLDVIAKLDVGGEYGMRNVFRLKPDELMELQPGKYDTIQDATYALGTLQDKFNSWLLEKIRTGAPIPGNRERRILNGDTTAGTWKGEVLRFLTQFKMTALKVFMDSTYGTLRKLNPEGPQGGNAVNWKNRESAYSMGTLAAHMTMAGAGLILINAILSNDEKTLKRFQEGDSLLVLDSFARGGGGFVLGDFIRMNSNKLANVAQLTGSPAISALATPPTAIGEMSKGNVGKATLDLTKTIVPGANLWFMKPFFSGMEDYARNSKNRHGKNINDPLK